MTKWKTYKIGAIIDEIAMGPFGSNIKVDNFIDFGVPVLNGANLQGFKLKEESFNYVSSQKADSLGKAKAYRGDIVITHRGTLGQIVYIPNDSKFERYIISQSQFRVRLNSQYVLPEYFVYYFHTRLGRHKLLMNASQVGVPALARPTSTFKDVTIDLPSLEEQRRIAGILGAIDDKIECNRRINANLESQAQALFDKIFFDDNDAERNPLSDYADINPTRTLRQGVVARYIEMANLPTRGSFPSDWSYKSYGGGCKFANGDTIMARITPCLENGKTAYIDFLEEQEVAFGSTEYIVISAKSGYCSALFYFLARNKEFVDYAVGHMNGSSGRQRVSGADIANFPMPHITLEESNKFAEIAMPIMDVIRNNSLENRHLATLRDTLLPKLMNGEIKL